MLVFQIGPSALRALHKKKTYFSALPATRQRPVIGLNQMSPRGDYSLNNGKLEKKANSVIANLFRNLIRSFRNFSDILEIAINSRKCQSLNRSLLIQL